MSILLSFIIPVVIASLLPISISFCLAIVISISIARLFPILRALGITSLIARSVALLISNKPAYKGQNNQNHYDRNRNASFHLSPPLVYFNIIPTGQWSEPVTSDIIKASE